MQTELIPVLAMPNVPQGALAFERLFLDAGAPKGAYTNVYISNQQAATVVADPRIKGVALTGSERPVRPWLLKLTRPSKRTPWNWEGAMPS
jgi:acyl-CoA reductase-like NAD-dependent aldehyde dehydrogenase